MSFRSQWKGIFLAECIQDIPSGRSTVDVRILLRLGLCFIECFVLIGLGHESLMPRFSVHDTIHDRLPLKQPICLFFRSSFCRWFGDWNIAMCLQLEGSMGAMYEGMDDFIAVGEEVVDKVHVFKAKNGKQGLLHIVG